MKEMSNDAEQQFSLRCRWNNFHNNLTCGFHELLEEKDLVDVTLACDGQYVQAHKLVLTVCSSYFKVLFKVNPNTHPIVILTDVNFSDLQAILQFMYRGEVNVKEDELANFLKTAEVLQIKGLTGDDKEPVFSLQQIQETTQKTTPSEPPSPSSAPPLKRKRTQEPSVTTPSPVATGSAPRARVSPKPPQVAPPEGDVEYIDVAKTKVESADYVDDDQYSRDELNEDDLCIMSASDDSLSSSSHVPPPLMAGPSTSRDSAGKEALQGIAGPTHDTSGPSSELTSQDDNKSQAKKNREMVLQSKTCPECSKVFCKSSNMKVHLRDSHGTTPPINCPICDIPIKNQSSLRVHMNRKHYSTSVTCEEITVPSVLVPSRPSSLSGHPNFIIIKKMSNIKKQH